VNLTLAANYAISGLNVASYHAFNLAVHILAALTLLRPGAPDADAAAAAGAVREAAIGLALATALVWEVHPLQTESVTYVIQRAESLAGSSICSPCTASRAARSRAGRCARSTPLRAPRAIRRCSWP